MVPLVLPAGRASCWLHTQSEGSHPSEDARPGGDTIARTHTKHGWEPKAHGNGPEYTTQGIEGVEEAAPMPHRAGRDERLSERGKRGTKTECRWQECYGDRRDAPHKPQTASHACAAVARE